MQPREPSVAWPRVNLSLQLSERLRPGPTSYGTRSETTHQKQHDDDDDDDADDADATVSVAVAISSKAATEAAKQEDNEKDEEYEPDRHGVLSLPL